MKDDTVNTLIQYGSDIVKMAATSDAKTILEKLKADKEKADYEITGLKRELLTLKAETIEKGEKILVFDDKLQGKLLQDFTISLMDKAEKFVACFSAENGVYRYSIASNNCDLREMCKALNSAFSGRGGGKPELVQGSLTGTEEEIREFLENYQ